MFNYRQRIQLVRFTITNIRMFRYQQLFLLIRKSWEVLALRLQRRQEHLIILYQTATIDLRFERIFVDRWTACTARCVDMLQLLMLKCGHLELIYGMTEFSIIFSLLYPSAQAVVHHPFLHLIEECLSFQLTVVLRTLSLLTICL